MLLEEVGKRLCNLREVLNKSSAIACETEEATELLHVLRRSAIENSLNSFRVDGNTILGDDMPKIGYFGGARIHTWNT